MMRNGSIRKMHGSLQEEGRLGREDVLSVKELLLDVISHQVDDRQMWMWEDGFGAGKSVKG